MTEPKVELIVTRAASGECEAVVVAGATRMLVLSELPFGTVVDAGGAQRAQDVTVTLYLIEGKLLRERRH